MKYLRMLNWDTHARERLENRSEKGQKNRYLSLKKIGTLYLLTHNIPY